MVPTAEAARDVTLTTEQNRVVSLGPEERALVTADAGTGKTLVLIARVAHLMREHDVYPGEILILSFTRAAVQVIRNRLAAEGGDSALATVRTFDSFATRLLHHTDPNGAWQERGDYETRIEAGTNAIGDQEGARDLVGSFRHVLVDELQDLVPPRDGFVSSILEASGGGFTLFGDPAQAIYEFQVASIERSGALAFYEFLRTEYDADLVELSLTENFRAQTDSVKGPLRFGPRLRDTGVDYPALRSELAGVVSDLTLLGSVSDAAAVLRNGFDGRTAILTRNNAQALLVSRGLWEEDVPHVLQRGAAERAVAPWVAQVLADLPQPRLKKRHFEELFEPLSMTPQAPPADEAWDALRRLCGAAKGSLDLAEGSRRLAIGDVPPELTPVPEHPLTVSTVHRSKGLEFDTVLLLEPEAPWDTDEASLAEEARVLYVSLSRARREMFVLERPKTSGYQMFEVLGGRWIKKGKWWQTFELELKADDIHDAAPGGAEVIDDDPSHIQNRLLELERGAPIALELVGDPASEGPTPRYAVKHRGELIGATSERFGRVLRTRFKKELPLSFVGARLDDLDTVSGPKAVGMEAGLGASGMWLRPRVTGLATVLWKPKS